MSSPQQEQDARVLKAAVEKGLISQVLAEQARREASATKTAATAILIKQGVLTQHIVDHLATPGGDPVQIAGFRIIGRLGEGGMGTVYRALQVSMNREVALKVIARQFAADPVFCERFLREARAAGAISHPHVITCFDVGQDQEWLYMALELMTGGDAASLAKQHGGRLPEAQALAIIDDCARGLGALHRAGLIHRDIKPANIFISQDGIAKLGDLGLARSTSGDDRMTMTGAAMGTPAFMSPEQASGESDLDIRTDIYALGATLFALLTGDTPFKGGSAFAVVAKVIHDPVPDPRQLHPAISGEAAAIVLTAMAKARAARYQTPEALSEDLQRILRASPTAVRTPALRPATVPLAPAAAASTPQTATGPTRPLERAALASEPTRLTPASTQHPVAAADLQPLPPPASAPAPPPRPAGHGVGWMLGGGIAAAVLAGAIWYLLHRPSPTPAVVAAGEAPGATATTSTRAPPAPDPIIAPPPPTVVATADQATARPSHPADSLEDTSLAMHEQPEAPAPQPARLAPIDTPLPRPLPTAAPATPPAPLPPVPVRMAPPAPAVLPPRPAPVARPAPPAPPATASTGRRAPRAHRGGPALSADQLDRYRARLVDDGLVADVTDAGDGEIAVQVASGTRSLRALAGLPVARLELDGCERLSDLSPLAELPLRALSLRECRSVQDLSALEDSAIEALDLTGCDGLEGDLRALRTLPLTDLRLAGCRRLTSLRGIEHSALTGLDLTDCRRLTSLEPVAGLPLHHLVLDRCARLTDLTGVSETSLAQLTISGCEALESLQPLSGTPLQHLTIEDCPRLRSLAGLDHMPLQDVHLTGCDGLTSLAGLRSPVLTQVVVQRAKNLVSLAGLRGCPVTTVELTECEAVAPDLAGLAGLPLRAVILRLCPHLVSLHGLERCPLERVVIVGCRRLIDLRAARQDGADIIRPDRERFHGDDNDR